MKTKAGKSWTMYLGDCLEVLPTLDMSAFVLVSDVPYGVKFSSRRGGAQGTGRIANDHDTAARDAALALYGDGPALVFGSWRVTRPQATKVVLTWDKGEHVGMGDLSMPWKPNTEEVYVLGSGFVGPRKGSVLRHLAIAGTVGVTRNADGTAAGGRLHSMQKPEGLMLELIERCPADRTVLDPFAGSGTTGVAAVRLGRRFVGIELDPKHFETACERLNAEEQGLTLAALRGGQTPLFGSR